MSSESYLSIIEQAMEMLKDRSEDEQLLIYEICMLPDEYRAGIIFAYKDMQKEKKERKNE
jgi:hypothetical protein